MERRLTRKAPTAGSGKTTLLPPWSAIAGAGRMAWVSLDGGDNDLARLWIYRKLDVAGRAEPVTERAGLASCPGRALSAMTTSPTAAFLRCGR
jgi:hypothetical protein